MIRCSLWLLMGKEPFCYPRRPSWVPILHLQCMFTLVQYYNYTDGNRLSEMVSLPPAKAESSRTYNRNSFAIISHNQRVQARMDKLNIAWGVQYEVARGVCEGRWDWNHLTDDMLGQLTGNNSRIAPRVSSIILGPGGIGNHSNYRLW
jgi:hypothetical protein